jgi:hypothetical protein
MPSSEAFITKSGKEMVDVNNVILSKAQSGFNSVKQANSGKAISV